MRGDATSNVPGDWHGARYDRLSHPQARWGLQVLERLELRGDETVLDAGCGSGRVTQELVKRLPGGQVIAFDASASMLRQAQQRLAPWQHQVTMVHGDLGALEPGMLAGAAPVDAIFSTATFHWVTDHNRLFSGLAGVLRPGGQLVAQCGGQGNIEAVLEAVRSLGVTRVGAWHYPSVDATVDRLRRAGFGAVQVWTHPEPTPFPDLGTLADFLETVCLREHLATLVHEERRDFVERVAAAMPAPVIDYVRLDMDARLAG